MKKTVLCVSAVLTFFTFLTEPLHSQTPTPNAGLTTVGVIPVPVWTPAGATSASFDLFSFNPLTRILYQADWRNHDRSARRAGRAGLRSDSPEDLCSEHDCTLL